MENKNRRRFTRIYFQWAVHLDFGLIEYKRYVANVSLSGFYVDGSFDQSIGDLCIIQLKQSGLYTNVVIRAVGSISRSTDNGIALEFHSMKLDSFFFLQASLLCKAVNPSILGNEFLDNEIFNIDGDIIFFRPYRLERG
ncbi:MAG: hypothetical protein D3924_00270 [Candidatus Electrothrix sp. AR4]|nr:hypothetical protein [Candidatus Electrothrix sp. AR4]